ncbi:MAG: hypothetical protein V7705_16365 [Leeuwenhoekiella marinoflava]
MGGIFGIGGIGGITGIGGIGPLVAPSINATALPFLSLKNPLLKVPL